MRAQRCGFTSASEIFRKVSWEDFRLVKAVAACGTLSSAANAIGINQSTAFRRLRALEATLSISLFDRHRSGYALTAAGTEMAMLAERIDNEIVAAVGSLAAQGQEVVGDLRVTMSDSIFVDLLALVLHRFAERHPGVALDIIASNDPLNLAKGEAHVAIRAGDRPPENLVGRRLATIAWALYGARSAELPGDLDELGSGRPWVCLNGNLGALRAQQSLETRLPRAKVASRVNSVLCAAAAIEAGLGVGYLPCITGDARPGLKRIGAPMPDLAGTLWLLTHRQNTQIPRVRAFIDMVAREVRTRRAVIEARSA